MRNHILLIDDDQEEVLFLCDAIQRSGVDHVCTWAKGLTHALKILDFLVPDVIIIDHNMPDGEGMESIRRIRAMKQLQPIPVILYSDGVSEVRDQALSAGADECIRKPMVQADFEAMFGILSRLINANHHNPVKS